MSDVQETLTRAIQGAITSAAAQHREVSELTWCRTLAEVLGYELAMIHAMAEPVAASEAVIMRPVHVANKARIVVLRTSTPKHWQDKLNATVQRQDKLNATAQWQRQGRL
jgi:hypothetical protein